MVLERGGSFGVSYKDCTHTKADVFEICSTAILHQNDPQLEIAKLFSCFCLEKELKKADNDYGVLL